MFLEEDVSSQDIISFQLSKFANKTPKLCSNNIEDNQAMKGWLFIFTVSNLT